MAPKGFTPTLLNGDIPVPTQPGAYAARVSEEVEALWRNVGFDPMVYGAAGDGTTNDAAAFTSMFTAITAAGGGVVNLSRNHRIGSAVALPSRVHIRGNGKTISAPSSGAISGLFTANSSANQSGTISTNVALFDRQLVLTSATGFTVGRIVSILKTVGGGIFYHHFAEIVDVAGSTIQITPPMPFPLLTSDTYTMTARAVKEDIVIEDVIFDGNNNASVTRGLLLQRTRRLSLRNLHFTGFHGAAGAYIDEGFATDIDNFCATHCGTGSEASVIIRAQTAMHAHGVNDWYSHGFGQLHFMLTNCQLDTLSSNRAGSSFTGRGVKFDGMLYSKADGVQGNDSSATGIAITLGSNFNTFSNLIALRNRGGSGNDVGIWFDGTSTDNVINGVIAKNNQTYDIDIPAGSDRNVIINSDHDTERNAGIDNIIHKKQNFGGVVLMGWADVNFNSANTDHLITIRSPSKYWQIESVVLHNRGTTASLTAARGGVFTGTGGGGTTIVTDTALSAITSNAVNSAANLLSMTIALSARWVDYTQLYYRTSTAQGAAATGRVYVFGRTTPA